MLGQLHGLYLLCASSEGLVIVDQHAAHERLAYEELKAGLARGRLPGQGLLSPATLELGPQESAWAAAQQEAWSRLGLELEPFGGNTWVVRSLPVVAAGADPEELVRGLLAELGRAGLAPRTPEFLEAALKGLACRSAIKSGQQLSRGEMEGLVARAAALPPPVTCPHGRPVFLVLSRRDLARWFKRSLEPLP